MGVASRTAARPMMRVHRNRGLLLRTMQIDGACAIYPLDDRTGPPQNKSRFRSASVTALSQGTLNGTYTLASTVVVPSLGEVISLGGGYVDIGDDNAFSPTGSSGLLTVEALVKPTAVNLSAQMVVTKHQEWQLRIESDGSLLWDINFNGSNAIMSPQTSASTMVAGVLHHIIATYDRAAPRAEIWLDGVSVASVTSLVTNNTVTANGLAVQIGRRSDAAGSVFGGPIGWVAIYRSVLSASRIAEHYRAISVGGL